MGGNSNGYSSLVNSFAFRKRSNTRLNWRLISRLDPDRIAADHDIDALQSVLETVTFSDIEKEDFSSFAEDFTKIFRLSQMIIEYLLFTTNDYIKTEKSQYEQKLAEVTKENESNRDALAASQREVERLKKALKAAEHDRDVAEKHDASHHKSGSAAATTHKCGLCDKAFVSFEHLLGHHQRRHNNAALFMPAQVAPRQNVITYAYQTMQQQQQQQMFAAPGIDFNYTRREVLGTLPAFAAMGAGPSPVIEELRQTIRGETDRLRDEENRLRNELNDLIGKKNASMDAINSKLSSIERDEDVIRRELKAINDRIDELMRNRQAPAAPQQVIVPDNSAREQFIRELAEKQSHIEALQAEIRRLRAALEELEKGHPALTAEIKRLRSELAAKIDEIEDLMAKLAKLRAQNAELTDENEHLRRLLRDSQNNAQLLEEIDMLRRQLRESENRWKTHVCHVEQAPAPAPAPAPVRRAITPPPPPSPGKHMVRRFSCFPEHPDILTFFQHDMPEIQHSRQSVDAADQLRRSAYVRENMADYTFTYSERETTRQQLADRIEAMARNTFRPPANANANATGRAPIANPPAGYHMATASVRVVDHGSVASHNHNQHQNQNQNQNYNNNYNYDNSNTAVVKNPGYAPIPTNPYGASGGRREGSEFVSHHQQQQHQQQQQHDIAQSVTSSNLFQRKSIYNTSAPQEPQPQQQPQQQHQQHTVVESHPAPVTSTRIAIDPGSPDRNVLETSVEIADSDKEERILSRLGASNASSNVSQHEASTMRSNANIRDTTAVSNNNREETAVEDVEDFSDSDQFVDAVSVQQRPKRGGSNTLGKPPRDPDDSLSTDYF